MDAVKYLFWHSLFNNNIVSHKKLRKIDVKTQFDFFKAFVYIDKFFKVCVHNNVRNLQ